MYVCMYRMLLSDTHLRRYYLLQSFYSEAIDIRSVGCILDKLYIEK